jgi:XTP/dITP diphosphohydrolase
MPELLLASANPGKIREYRSLLDGVGYRIVTLADRGMAGVVIESGDSYEQNASLKATAHAASARLVTVADDSGLEVDAIDGEPGVFSARFAGEDATDWDRIQSLLARLEGIPWEKRTARFKCVIAVATPGGELELCHGECLGIVALEPRGALGFGYDPVFYLPDLGKTMAELPLEVKNQVSHRARASATARQVLKRLIDSD